MAQLNALNRKIREALSTHPETRTKALKVAASHAASSSTNSVIESLCDLVLASKSAKPRFRKLTERIIRPVWKLARLYVNSSQRDYHHLSDFAGLEATDFNFCRFWGFVEKDPERRGYYKPTLMLWAFLAGKISVPSRIHFNGNGLKDRYTADSSGKYVTVNDLISGFPCSHFRGMNAPVKLLDSMPLASPECCIEYKWLGENNPFDRMLKKKLSKMHK